MIRLLKATLIATAMLATAATAGDGLAMVFSKQVSPGVWQSGWLILITSAGREAVFVGVEVTGNMVEGQRITVNGKTFTVNANVNAFPD